MNSGDYAVEDEWMSIEYDASLADNEGIRLELELSERVGVVLVEPGQIDCLVSDEQIARAFIDRHAWETTFYSPLIVQLLDEFAVRYSVIGGEIRYQRISKPWLEQLIQERKIGNNVEVTVPVSMLCDECKKKFS